MKTFITITAFLFISINIFPQFEILKKVKEKVKEKTEQKVNEGIDKGVDKAMDPDTYKQDSTAQQNGDTTVVNVNQTENTQVTELKSYSKFDFVPGEQVLFFEDFSQDNIGDFPALWNTNGSAEVVNTNLFPGNWMQFLTRDAIWTDNLLELPDNYTIEFDVVPIKGNEGGMGGYGFRLMQSINAKSFDHGSVPGKAGLEFYVEYFGRPGYRTYINSDEGQALGLTGSIDNSGLYQKENQKYHISIWIQKSRVRVYQNESKLFDLPKAFSVQSVKMDRIRFEDGAALVSNIRIAVGAPDMRSKLLTEGKLVTRGILFDVNSDKIKPESYGTLKEIAKVLQDNVDLKVKIVGHTDSDGSDESNLDLSKRRAISVKSSLNTEFGIDGARMETDGKGESEPATDNTTPEGKANNRRVEFIKL